MVRSSKEEAERVSGWSRLVENPSTTAGLLLAWLLLVAVGHVLLIQDWAWERTRALNEGLASFSAWLVRPLVGDLEVHGIVIAGQDFEVHVLSGCEGLDGLVVLLLALMLFPATRRQKLKGVAVGLPVLAAAAVLRTASRVLLMDLSAGLESWFHANIFGPGGVVLPVVCLALWASWLAVSTEGAPPVDARPA